MNIENRHHRLSDTRGGSQVIDDTGSCEHRVDIIDCLTLDEERQVIDDTGPCEHRE